MTRTQIESQWGQRWVDMIWGTGQYQRTKIITIRPVARQRK